MQAHPLVHQIVRHTRIPFKKVGTFSRTDLDYYHAEKALRPFYKYPVSLYQFGQIVKDKRRQQIPRQVLYETLVSQYAKCGVSTDHLQALLSDKCFTVTTAHQPVIFGGPLYVMYKICATIHLARSINAHYTGFNVLPVFVIGDEDHDFEEVASCSVFGNTITWDHTGGGSVGHLPTESLAEALQNLDDILGTSPYAEDLRKILHVFREHKTYGEAMQAFFLALFEDTELIVLRMDDAALKRAFIPVFKEELMRSVSFDMIQETQQALNDAGYDAQAYTREINVFYRIPGLRERLVRGDSGHFAVHNTAMRFTPEELDQELHDHPERFSPNVNLRPLYQESILPNLAYIGGGGEIAYWLERKAQFQYFGVNFPMLIRRNSCLWIDRSSVRKMEKLDLGTDQIFAPADQIVREWVHTHSDNTISFDPELKDIESAFARIAEKAGEVDPTLSKAVLAEQSRVLKSADQLANRIFRAEKKAFDTSVKQIKKLKEKLFPDMGLQERHDNFIPMYLKYGRQYLDILMHHLDPMRKGFIVFEDA